MSIIIFLLVVEVILICRLISLPEDSKSNNKFEIDFKFAYFKDIEYSRIIFEQQELEKRIKLNNKILRERKIFVAENGYVYFVDSHKSVHRWVMEKSLGRKLSHKEVVHHIDGNKQNNKIYNLKLFPNQEAHDKYHREHLKNYGTWYEEIPSYPIFTKKLIHAR